MLLCCFEPGLLQGFGYGIAQISRGAYNALLVLAALAIYEFVRKTRTNTARPRLTLTGKKQQASVVS